MSHQTGRLVVLVLCVWGPVITGLVGPGSVSAAPMSDPTTRVIRFDEIETLAREAGPRLRILDEQLEIARAERDDALQWSLPQLAYDREHIVTAEEWQVTVHKRLSNPLSQKAQRRGWEAYVRAEGHRQQQETAEFLADLKTGYVRLRLLETYVGRLGKLAELIELASGFADSRHAEGNLSGAEKHLIRLSAYGVEAHRRQVKQQHRELGATWAADVGIPGEAELKLTTPITYDAVALQDVGDYVALLEDRPAVSAQTALAQAWADRASAAHPSILPGIDLYGGYKKYEPSSDGFVAGIAVDLPLFHHKAGEARLYEARRRVVEYERAADLARATKEVESLVRTIEEAQPALAGFADALDRDPPLTDTLLFSYREGSLTLDALLNAIQIEMAALETYYQELSLYYRSLFRLEAVTGISIAQIGS